MNKKLNARTLTEEEKVKIGEYLMDDYNQLIHKEEDKMTLEQSLEYINSQSLLQAFDTDNLTYVIMVGFHKFNEEDALYDKIVDEFVIKNDGVVETAYDYDLV